MNLKYSAISLILLAIQAASPDCAAAEFSNDDVAPTIDTFVLTESLVAVAVEPGYRLPRRETYPRYFAARRPAYEFERISEEDFSRIRSLERYERRFGTFPVFPEDQAELPGWTEISPRMCSKYDYESDAKTTRDFGSGSSRISLEISCRTFVSRAISVDDEVWIGTYRSGEFGDYSAEGILVLSRTGDELRRIDVEGPIKDVVQDPWGTDIWALSPYGLTAIKPNHEIFAVRWPVHQFDHTKERPDVAIPSKPATTDPLAVIAYTLGETHYAAFSSLVANSTYVPHQELLYQYFMSARASEWAEPAYLPDELESLLDVADSTPQWGRFSCFLRGDRAKTMCDRWLARQNE